MKISGLQKTTLIDYPGKIACTIFLYGCNFNCGFCYNSELVNGKISEHFSEEKILEFLKKKKGKIDAVCITGGEPMLSLEKDFVKKIRELGYLIKIDTNGSIPEKLKEFIDEKLVDYIAMDIKNSKEKYESTISSKIDIKKIEESIKLIYNFEKYEFRTTIVPLLHTKEDIISIGKWISSILQNKKPKKYYLQGFKNEGIFIDQKYSETPNTREKFLYELKEEVKPFFERVMVRY